MSLALVPAWSATSAQASVPSNFCSGKSYTYLVKTYIYGAERLALRCGTATWASPDVSSGCCVRPSAA